MTLAMRLSSKSTVRIHWARGGASTPDKDERDDELSTEGADFAAIGESDADARRAAQQADED